jgi:hypothetical protein
LSDEQKPKARVPRATRLDERPSYACVGRRPQRPGPESSLQLPQHPRQTRPARQAAIAVTQTLIERRPFGAGRRMRPTAIRRAVRFRLSDNRLDRERRTREQFCERRAAGQAAPPVAQRLVEGAPRFTGRFRYRAATPPRVSACSCLVQRGPSSDYGNRQHVPPARLVAVPSPSPATRIVIDPSTERRRLSRPANRPALSSRARG